MGQNNVWFQSGLHMDALQIQLSVPLQEGKRALKRQLYSWLFLFERNSFFYLLVRTQHTYVALHCLYLAYSCTKHRRQPLPFGSKTMPHKKTTKPLSEVLQVWLVCCPKSSLTNFKQRTHKRSGNEAVLNQGRRSGNEAVLNQGWRSGNEALLNQGWRSGNEALLNQGIF